MRKSASLAVLHLSRVLLPALFFVLVFFAPHSVPAAVPQDPDEVLVGTIQGVNVWKRQFTVADKEGRKFTVQLMGTPIFLTPHRPGLPDDLKRGMKVEVLGTHLDDNRFEARMVRVVPKAAPEAEPAGSFKVEGVVREVETAIARAILADADGRRFTIDYLDAALLRGGSRLGRRAYLTRGMHIEVVGTRLPHSVVVADKVRILGGEKAAAEMRADENEEEVPRRATPDLNSVQIPTPDALVPGAVTVRSLPPAVGPGAVAPPPVSAPTAAPAATARPIPASPDPRETLDRLDTFTGVLIDARHLPEIARSPAPTITGPGKLLAYPDRSHVPTPDEVQEQSVIRYYMTIEDAKAGVAGSNPLILPAQAILGPARDITQLSAADVVLLLALDQKLQFSRTWKVGILLPPDR
jgi:hypothetical protein